MNTDSLTRPRQMLFALLKLALWNKFPDQALFEDATEAAWDEIFNLSVRHGISAIVLDGVILLPKELQPPRSVKLKWIISVEAIESGYEKKLAVANEIAAAFAENNIEMLIFKGFGLSQFYPVPAHRESCDIDFYLFGKQKEGDCILIQNGAVKDHDIDKHGVLQMNGVLLENHNYFLSEIQFKNVAALEKHLQKTLAGSKFLSNPFVNKALFPPPDFNMLFILCHSYGHYFIAHLFLKHLCDWAIFLKANKGNIDFEAYREAIDKFHLLKFADAFTALAVKYLDLEPELAPPYAGNPELENRILQESFEPLNPLNFKNLSLPEIVKLKIERLKSRKWRYDEYLGPCGFYKAIGNSIIFHLCHPKSIMK